MLVKYTLNINKDINYEKVSYVYNKHKLEIYDIIIYLWIDIIYNKGEEDPELLKLFNDIYNGIINSVDIKELDISFIDDDIEKDKLFDKVFEN